MKRLKYLIVLLPIIFSFFSIVTFASDARPEVAEQVKAWKGEEGVVIWTLRYGKLEENKALVQIVGIDHSWDRKIFLMNVEQRFGRKYYYMDIKGRRYNVFVINKYQHGELYLPDGGKEISILAWYNNELSAEGNAQYFLTDYLEQKSPSS